MSGRDVLGSHPLECPTPVPPKKNLTTICQQSPVASFALNFKTKCTLLISHSLLTTSLEWKEEAKWHSSMCLIGWALEGRCHLAGRNFKGVPLFDTLKTTALITCSNLHLLIANNAKSLILKTVKLLLQLTSNTKIDIIQEKVLLTLKTTTGNSLNTFQLQIIL